jgi:hypothetical protein
MKQADIEDIARVAPVIGLLDAWRAFKRTHDLNLASVCCCERTRKLFETLDEFERGVLGPSRMEEPLQ